MENDKRRTETLFSARSKEMSMKAKLAARRFGASFPRIIDYINAANNPDLSHDFKETVSSAQTTTQVSADHDWVSALTKSGIPTEKISEIWAIMDDIRHRKRDIIQNGNNT